MRGNSLGRGCVLAWISLAMACGDATERTGGGAATGGSAGSDGPAGSAGMGGSAGSAGLGGSADLGGSTGVPVELTRLTGSPCVPAAELDTDFSGFAASDVTVEATSPYCETGVCLVDHFQGRVSCPYGQNEAGALDANPVSPEQCQVPGSSERITARVLPQRLDRRADAAVYCSCRCDGPDPAASYCQCGAGFACAPRVSELVSAEHPELAGSYCVRTSDATTALSPDATACEATTQSCGDELALPPELDLLAPELPTAASSVPRVTASPYLLPQATQRKLDLLFAIDNSIFMADKQESLARAVPELLARLANPVCVDAAGREFPAPAPGATCAEGQRRQFAPITDLHVGFVSSSLGDAGANSACPGPGLPRFIPDRVDMAHLIGSLPRGQNAGGNALGFLEWSAGQADFDLFADSAQRLLRSVGESGCGWEQTLESWYRFLADPYPYRELVRVVCPGSQSTATNCVQPAVDADGRILLDDTLLAQRQAFLRPDSLLAIAMLSDENDCSLQVGNQSWVFVNLDDQRPMFKGSSTCAQDANDQCCFNCALGPPVGCDVDPSCSADPANINRLPLAEDGLNLRCFDQQRRFGIEILQPVQRYINALTRFELCWNAPDLSVEGCDVADIAANPLFVGGRTPSQVLLSGLVGVPWQSLAAQVNAAGAPLRAEQLRFKSAVELSAGADTTWSQIVGSPGVRWQAATTEQPEVASVPRVLPTLAQMVESEFPRVGVVAGNPLNGRDFDTSQGGSRPDDLEYACIYSLRQLKDCAALDPSVDYCACYAGQNSIPLCEQTPGQSTPGTTQYWEKAYPGARQLQVLRGYGDNAVVASICPRNLSNAAALDFGYRPALSSLLERIEVLSAPSLDSP